MLIGLFKVPNNKLFQQKGVVQLLVLGVMAFLVLGLPLTTKLVQQNQENRSQAALVLETDGGGGGSVNTKACSLANCGNCTTSSACSGVTGCTWAGGVCIKRVITPPTSTPIVKSTSKPQTLPKCSLKSGGYCAKSCSNGFYYNKNKSDCGLVSYCCKPKPTPTQKPTNQPVVKKTANGGGGSKETGQENIDSDISILCNVGDKRCQGGKLEFCSYVSQTIVADWVLVQNCENGCDDKLFLCKASCGINEFLSNDMSAKPKDNLCKAGTMSGFDSETDNNSWSWTCGGDNLSEVSCKAARMPYKILLSEASLKLEVGKSKKIQARLVPNDKDERIIWKSDNSSVAVVDSTGTIKAVSEGKVVVRLSTVKNRSAEIAVTVIPNSEKCIDKGKIYNNNESRCFESNKKILMTCQNGQWINSVCKHGCENNKCRAGCGLDIFFSRNDLDSPSEDQLCSLGKPEYIEPEVSLVRKPYAYVSWTWRCSGDNLTAVVCEAKRGVYCDSKEGICVSSGSECNREYNGNVISGTDDCQTKAMVCCKTNTQIKIKKITIDSPGILVVGQKKQIKYNIEPSDATEKISWSSSNLSILKIDQNTGMVEAVVSGAAKIMAMVGGVEKKSINIKVVNNEGEICLNLSRNNCLSQNRCFWKNSGCSLIVPGDAGFCRGRSGDICSPSGAKINCQDGRIISWFDDDPGCLIKAQCNEETKGKYRCEDDGFRAQCVSNNNSYSKFSWLNLGKCENGCQKGECLSGYKCDGIWSEKFDQNNQQVGHGIRCNNGCDSKTGRCLCSFGSDVSQKRPVGGFACFNNSEYVCRENGFFEKVKDCIRCGKDKCAKYVPEDANLVMEYEYRCQNIFWGGSFLVKYFKGTNVMVGDKIQCEWGCDGGMCKCRDNWGVYKRGGQMTCINGSQYRCDSGSWVFEKKCYECKKNGECIPLDETNKQNQCQSNGGVCVEGTRNCTTGKIIPFVNTCATNKPICCQQKKIETVINIVELKKCEMLYTEGPPPYDVKQKVNHGTIRCDKEHKNVDICDNGEVFKYQTCYSKKCRNGKCVDF